jgi:hypothetical protein
MNNAKKSHRSKNGGVFAGTFYKVTWKKGIDTDVKTPGHRLDKNLNVYLPFIRATRSFKPSIVSGSSSTSPKSILEMAKTMSQHSYLNRRTMEAAMTLLKERASKKEHSIIKKNGIPLHGPAYAGCIGFPLNGRDLDSTSALIIGTNYSSRRLIHEGDEALTQVEWVSKKVRKFTRNLTPNTYKLGRRLEEAAKEFSEWIHEESSFHERSKIPNGYVAIVEVENYLPDVLQKVALHLNTDKRPVKINRSSFARHMREVRNTREQIVSRFASLHTRKRVIRRTASNWILKNPNKPRLANTTEVVKAELLQRLKETFPVRQRRALRDLGLFEDTTPPGGDADI